MYWKFQISLHRREKNIFNDLQPLMMAIFIIINFLLTCKPGASVLQLNWAAKKFDISARGGRSWKPSNPIGGFN
jgi:hypothetical protein